jgi:hypothetical protein
MYELCFADTGRGIPYLPLHIMPMVMSYGTRINHDLADIIMS